MREVCEETRDGGDTAQKRREGGKDHCGVQFLCNMSCVLQSPCLLPPHQNVPCPMDWASGVCSCWLSSVCRPKRERSGKRTEEKHLNEGDTRGFFVSPSGTDGTAAKTWIEAQESAMCPTDGPSKYEGTSCTDGQFCMCRVQTQMAKSAKD